MNNTKKGFTLIEVLIVVSIIGILASIVLVGLGAFRTRGRDTRRLADIRQIQGALELYYSKFGRYPAGDFAAAKTALELPANGLGVNRIPSDPSAPTKTYEYGTDGSGTTYILKAGLEGTGNPAVNDDVDGTVLSVNCGTQGGTEVEYCVQF